MKDKRVEAEFLQTRADVARVSSTDTAFIRSKRDWIIVNRGVAVDAVFTGQLP